MKIETALRKAEQLFLSLPNVTGVGIGEKDGKPVIKVFVTRMADQSTLQSTGRIPAKIGGYATDVEEIGIISAQDEPNDSPDHATHL